MQDPGYPRFESEAERRLQVEQRASKLRTEAEDCKHDYVAAMYTIVEVAVIALEERR